MQRLRTLEDQHARLIRMVADQVLTARDDPDAREGRIVIQPPTSVGVRDTLRDGLPDVDLMRPNSSASPVG